MGRVNNNYPIIELAVIGEPDGGQSNGDQSGSGQNLSVSEDFGLSSSNKLSLKVSAKRALFYDLWDEAADDYGTSNRDTGLFSLNGVIGINYPVALEIYQLYSARRSADLRAAYSKLQLYTLLPIWVPELVSVDLSNAFKDSAYLKKIVFKNSANSFVVSDMTSAFQGCRNLKEIVGTIRFSDDTVAYIPFNGCWALETVTIKQLNKDLQLTDCPHISAESLSNMVNYAKENNSPFTIKVHEDTYAKLTGDTTNEEAAAMTAEELAQWQAIATAASSRRITFATLS